MKIEAHSPEQYIEQLPDGRKQAIIKLRKAIRDNLPEGFEETMGYGMIGFVVPKSIYPAGYHSTPELPLPFINIASQKSFIALYHMGLSADSELLKRFKTEYTSHVKSKLDMGKSCIRFKNISQIPFELIAELAGKMTSQQWINIYETTVKRKR